MIASTQTSNLGRHAFGAAALAFGLIALVWHDYRDWDGLRHLLNDADGPVFVYVSAVAQIAGGAALQFSRTAKSGALLLAAVYLAFAALCVPRIVVTPQVYDAWGNFFEQFSLATGAALVYGRLSETWSHQVLERAGGVLFGLCVASFALEQLFYLDATAQLVPKWLPPSRTFWAETTTLAFGLAAASLLTDRLALTAARLLTLMLLAFGLLVWMPILVAAPRSHWNWSETIETFAIAAVAWILTELLAKHRRPESKALAAVGQGG